MIAASGHVKVGLMFRGKMENKTRRKRCLRRVCDVFKSNG